MRSIKYLACQPKRGELLESIYALMRYLDDIADRDSSLPKGYSSAMQYIQRKIDFAQGQQNPQDPAEKLLLHCLELAQQIDENIRSEINDILQSLHFDAKRRNPDSLQCLPREELQHHFYSLDIRGTIGLCLKLAQEHEVQIADLRALGEASRIEYSIKDFADDIRAGFNNVPIEDAEALGLSTEEMRDSSSEKVQQWLYQEAERGMGLLANHRARLPTMRLQRLTKAALWFMYERPANRLFRHILDRQK
ncbi:MAG TPA: squalene/phytoene synthase family protein [Candidatus Peribacterales bacterium]|nr:squalene/phytoene synthase family protein [Candidatus Peribacterales bacterium]